MHLTCSQSVELECFKSFRKYLHDLVYGYSVPCAFMVGGEIIPELLRRILNIRRVIWSFNHTRMHIDGSCPKYTSDMKRNGIRQSRRDVRNEWQCEKDEVKTLHDDVMACTDVLYYWFSVKGKPTLTDRFPSQRVGYAELCIVLFVSLVE